MKNKRFTKLYKLSPREKYAEWFAFPSIFRRMDDNQLIILGINPEDIDPILRVRTKTEVAKNLGYSRETLYLWEKEKDFIDIIRKAEIEFIGNKTPNVLAGLYRGAIKDGDAARVKLWMQIFRGFTEKSETKHTVDLEEIKKMTETLKGLAEDDSK